MLGRILSLSAEAGCLKYMVDESTLYSSLSERLYYCTSRRRASHPMKKPVAIAVACLCVVAGALAVVLLVGQNEKVSLSNARIELVPEREGLALIYVDILNSGPPDRLVGASSTAAKSAKIIGAASGGGLPIPAGSTPSLSGDGAHLMLEGVQNPLVEGSLVPFALEFERSGRVASKAATAPSADPHDMHRGMGGQMMQHDGLDSMERMEDTADTGGRTDMATDSMMMTEPGVPPPSIEMAVTQAESEEWLVELTTENFIFDVEQNPPVHVPNHGHGHLYIDGLKIGRMYAPVAEIGRLPSGQYTVSVTLNSNTHQPYTDDNGQVRAEAVITSK